MEALEIKGKHEMFGVLATGKLTCLVFHAIVRFSRGIGSAIAPYPNRIVFIATQTSAFLKRARLGR